MIMYRVSEWSHSIQFSEHEVVKQTKVSVFYMNGDYRQREQKLKSKTIWFESKKKALATALSWAHEMIEHKKYALNCAIKSNEDIELIVLGGAK